ISQLTKDHTFVQSLIDEGRITEEESRVHPHRNLILRAVDGVHETEPDLFLVDLVPGDRIMLCSDGASGVLDDPALAAILRTGTAEACAVELIREALEAGSSDNVTVVVADVVDTDAEDPEETQAVLIGPIVVGAAAEKRKGLGGRRQRKKVDTGELEPVPSEPGDQRSGGGVDPEAIRYAPRPPRRFVWLRRVAVVAVIGVLLWLGGSSAYAWTQKQYYVAPSADQVAIYRGVEAELPIVRLHHVYETSQVKVSQLPDFFKGQVRAGMGATNLDDARAIVQRLGRAADCTTGTGSAVPATPSATPSASPTRAPTAKPTTKKQRARARASRSAAAKASRSASPSASATPSPGSTNCANTP
ncbi:MAG: serine/threonine-protein phosphatase, partial [Marmoricola sp.]